MRLADLTVRTSRLIIAAVMAGLLVSMLVSATPERGTPGGSKIAAELRAKLEHGVADFWIRLGPRAESAGAREITDWAARGQRVMDTLAGTATATQGRVRALLDARGLRYQPFWVTNAILVRGGSLAAATELSTVDSVAEIRSPRTFAQPDPIPAAASNTQAAVEWGVANIHADQVWAELGDRGQGVVVGNIDTGVQFDHPALVSAYRGNNGDGSFTHDYNWLDTSGACPAGPCDADVRFSHGTHTMGTMVGDGGPGNQVGVAPGARWIAANGCATCSDVDLVEAAQWMLAPTRTGGADPDPAHRPHVINNSIGSSVPSTDPFLEDIQHAWADAGIFALWANGNLGPSCGTSSTPGSRAISYSVGAYDSGNVIAPFSSRGAGQDGRVKPDIAAPGVAVRSTQQGNGYGLLSGTSMATPHVAGSVALLWSANPALIGDVDATRELLDLTAVDAADDRCGGTGGDNNVYGEGRLDALALVHAGSTGGTGTLTGFVRDALSSQPVRGATVAVTGPVNRSATTGPDGDYSLRLLPGEYSVTTSLFGYAPDTQRVVVDSGATQRFDVGLARLDTVLVSGSVLDGSGHGWPLYAKITVVGAGIDPVFTDPYTGRYALRLPSSSTHTLRVEARYPGYPALTEVVQTGTGGEATHDIRVPVDLSSCSAPGYARAVHGVRSHFDAPTVPDGWTVTDNSGNGGVWVFNDPGNRGNQTGGTGGFAVLDGDYLPDFTVWNSDLITPVADLTGVAAPALDFNIDYVATSNATGMIDLSLDGGQTWQNIYRQRGGSRRLHEHIELPQAAGATQARLRFHYSTFNTGWWQLDDVVFGAEFCAPVAGGLVAGQVIDANTHDFLAGAKVTSGAATTTSAATPDDAALPDGFYWMFLEQPGPHSLAASRASYLTDAHEVNLAPDWVTSTDFTLRAGRLVINPQTVASTQKLGETKTKTVTFTNQGTAPVDVTLREDGGDKTILAAGAGAPTQRVAGTFRPGRQGNTVATQQEPANATPAAAPWRPIANYPEPIMSNSVVTAADGTLYSVGGATSGGRIENAVLGYDPRTGAWTRKAAMGWEREKPAAAYLDGKVYVVGGWWVNGLPERTLEIYNPASDSWTTGTPVPVAFAASGVGVAGGDVYVVGGCDANVCGHNEVFAYSPATGSWRPVAGYPEPVSWTSCGGIGDKLYCAGGVREVPGGIATTTHTYVYDPASDGWAPVADLPMDLWGAGYAAVNGRLVLSGGSVNNGNLITNEGVAYDPAANAWTPIPNSNEAVYRGGSSCGLYKVGGSVGGFTPIPRGEVLPGYGNCGSSAELPWLSESATAFHLEPGQRVTVTLTLDAAVAAVDQPGSYTGRITVANNSPYAAALDVAMTVNPPKEWGKLTGSVAGKRCDGSTLPLAGATVAIDSWAASYTLRTDIAGNYALWLDRRNNPLSVIAALDGWRPQAKTVRIKAGTTTVTDFILPTTASCSTN